MLGVDALPVARLNGGLKALRERLRGRAIAEILQPLYAGGPDALLLLLDVGHRVKRPASAGAADGTKGRSARRGAVQPPPYTRRVDERTGRRLARSTALFSAATGFSRVLGLVREIVASYYFGAAGKINAFTVAFQVPNLFRSLVADQALSAAFVPVFTELLEKGDKRRAWRVASTLFWLFLLGLGGLTAFCILIAPWIIKPFGDPGGDPELGRRADPHALPGRRPTRTVRVVVGILNSYEQFTVPALTPVFWNAAIIAGLVFGVPRQSSCCRGSSRRR